MFNDLAALFGTVLNAKILKFCALRPEEEHSVRALSAALSARPEEVRSSLTTLLRLQVLRSKSARGERVFFWNTEQRDAEALAAFVTLSTMPSDALIARTFKSLGVSTIMVAGALVGESRGALELLLVTRRPDEPRLARAVKRLEAATATPIRYAVLETREYERRRGGYDRLLRDITDFRHRIIGRG